MYRFDEPAGSCWEAMSGPPPARALPLRGDWRVDVAIIGGGFTGLSAALHLARDHALRACVLEAGEPGWGASGRNGGFCCLYPSSLPLATLLAQHGEDDTRAFLRSQCAAIDLVRDIASGECIDIRPQGDGIYEVAHAPGRYAALEAQARLLSMRLGIPARCLPRERFAAEGHDSTEQFGALHVGAGFGLDPLAFVRGLAAAATRHGARIHARSEVIGWERDGARHRLLTSEGAINCATVIVATNGYTPERLVPALHARSVPVISNIIATRPLTAAELAAQQWHTETPCANTRGLLFYYRLLPDRRFLFGARGDTTGSPGAAARMRAWMTRRFGEVFPAWRDVPVTHYWRGFVCMNANGVPSVGPLADDASVLHAIGCHGNGIAWATDAGRLLAALAGGRASARDIPRVMRGSAPRIPLPSLRPWYLRAAIARQRWLDRQ